MKIDSARAWRLRSAAVVVAVFTVVGLVGCSDASPVDRAQAQVTAKEKAVKDAKAAQTAASAKFCQSSKTYIMAVDRYGDVLNQTAPTVGDVTDAGKDLVKPRATAFDSAEAAAAAQQELARAEKELAEAQAALDRAKAGPSASAAPAATPVPTSTALVQTATVDRVKQAESEFSAAEESITDKTTLADASQQFNSAAVALEFAWLRLFAEAGCLSDQQAQATVSTYVTALQQNLTAAGYYSGAVDGVYGPQTVAAVEDLQKASGLPVTGAVDKATAAALDAKLQALGGAAAKQSTASTAAVQQSLKLVGFWDGPVDGVWTPALTEALMAFQSKLGVEPTGEVDAATVSAFERALAELKQPNPAPSPSSTPAG